MSEALVMRGTMRPRVYRVTAMINHQGVPRDVMLGIASETWQDWRAGTIDAGARGKVFAANSQAWLVENGFVKVDEKQKAAAG